MIFLKRKIIEIIDYFSSKFLLIFVKSIIFYLLRCAEKSVFYLIKNIEYFNEHFVKKLLLLLLHGSLETELKQKEN